MNKYMNCFFQSTALHNTKPLRESGIETFVYFKLECHTGDEPACISRQTALTTTPGPVPSGREVKKKQEIY